MRPYLKDPAAIRAQSRATIAIEARLDRFPTPLHPLISALVEASGMVEVADRLVFSSNAVAKGKAALSAGAPVLCDSAMLAAGIGPLPAGNAVICTTSDPRCPDIAAGIGNTPEAAAVELWRDDLEDAVVAIGSAPTALFQLLERLDQGWPRPALVIGLPAGFSGAAEAKAELSARPRSVEYITLRGRRGGPGLAAAAITALSVG